MGAHDSQRKNCCLIMNTSVIIIIMTAVIFYTYIGYGLVVWVMLKIRQIKKGLWSTHK